MTVSQPIIIRAGEVLNVQCEAGSEIQIGNHRGVIYSTTAQSPDLQIKTADFPDGKYTVVVTKDDILLSSQSVTILPLFQKQTRKDHLIEKIELIEKVIDARLSGDEAALQSMTVKGNTFMYESLSVLQQLKRDYTKELSKIVEAERRKKGHSPITNIRIRFTR